MELRPYQAAAISALWAHLESREDNPVIVLPTGGGKSLLQAEIAKGVHGWGGRVLFISHVKELIRQVADHIREHAPGIPLGIYSAGLKSRDLGYAVTVAGIQSVFERSGELGKIDLAVVDEAHRIPAEGEGMYRTLFSGLAAINPGIRLAGLTATPYRTSSGLIARPENLLNRICHETTVRELIRDGYLCPLRTKSGAERFDLSGVHVRAGEFVQEELERAMASDDRKVALACLDIGARTVDLKSVLVFACGIDHARKVADRLSELGAGAVRCVFGETSPCERDQAVLDFKSGGIKYLVNVGVYTEGFDAPNVDAVVVLRPTLSPGLWCQMVGRGLRMSPGKSDCLVLDYGENARRHGPIDTIRAPKAGHERPVTTRECPKCLEVVSYSRQSCPDCGHVFPPSDAESRSIRHGIVAGDSEIVGIGAPTEIYDVERVLYWKHRKRGAVENHPPTLWVEYDCGIVKASEWICFEHGGFARSKAAKWWRLRSDEPFPETVDAALEIVGTKGIKEPGRIEIAPDGKYLRIKRAMDFAFRPQTEPTGKPTPPPLGRIQEEKSELSTFLF